MDIRCHLRHCKPLRTRVLRTYDVIYGTVDRCAHVFYGRTMPSTAPLTVARTFLRAYDVIYGTINCRAHKQYGRTMYSTVTLDRKQGSRAVLRVRI